jgi:hypothetical protein
MKTTFTTEELGFIASIQEDRNSTRAGGPSLQLHHSHGMAPPSLRFVQGWAATLRVPFDFGCEQYMAEPT